MNTQEKQAIKEVLFDYNAETIEFAGDIADRILRKLNEIRKPSERPNVKDYFAATETLGAIHNEIVKAPRLYAYMQALDAYIDNLEEKPSEPETNAVKAWKELVSEVAVLMQPNNELLDALKKICMVAPSYIKNPDDELDNAICEAMLAVYNYEKQGK